MPLALFSQILLISIPLKWKNQLLPVVMADSIPPISEAGYSRDQSLTLQPNLVFGHRFWCRRWGDPEDNNRDIQSNISASQVHGGEVI